MPARNSRLGVNPLDVLDLEEQPSTTATRSRIMVNTRLDPELVAEAKKLARLSGDSLTALVTEAIGREIGRRKKTLAKRLREELATLEGGGGE